MIVVATLYQLSQTAGKFDLKQKTLLRKHVKVNDEYAKHITENFEVTGKIYEIDEKATQEWSENKESVKQSRIDLTEAKKTLNVDAMAEVFTEVANKRGRKPNK